MPSMTKGYMLQGGTPVKIVPLEVNTPGTVYAAEGEAFNPVKTDVSGALEAKTETITENGETEIKPSDGKIGISSLTLTVSVPPYAIASASETDTVTAEAVDGATYFGFAFDGENATLGQCAVAFVDDTPTIDTSFGGGTFAIADEHVSWTVADATSTTLYRVDSTENE